MVLDAVAGPVLSLVLLAAFPMRSLLDWGTWPCFFFLPRGREDVPVAAAE